MDSKNRSTLPYPVSLAVGFALLGSLAWGLYWVSSQLINVSLQDSALAVAVIGGGGWLIKSSYESTLERRRRNAERKLSEYQEFIDFMNEIVARRGEGLNDDRIADLRRWSMGLSLFASDDVIRIWNRFRQGARTATPAQTISIVSELFMAMRKDCGMHHTRLRRDELLSLFINSSPDADSTVEGTPAT